MVSLLVNYNLYILAHTKYNQLGILSHNNFIKFDKILLNFCKRSISGRANRKNCFKTFITVVYTHTIHVQVGLSE